MQLVFLRKLYSITILKYLSTYHISSWTGQMRASKSRQRRVSMYIPSLSVHSVNIYVQRFCCSTSSVKTCPTEAQTSQTIGRTNWWIIKYTGRPNYSTKLYPIKRRPDAGLMLGFRISSCSGGEGRQHVLSFV